MVEEMSEGERIYLNAHKLMSETHVLVFDLIALDNQATRLGFRGTNVSMSINQAKYALQDIIQALVSIAEQQHVSVRFKKRVSRLTS